MARPMLPLLWVLMLTAAAAGQQRVPLTQWVSEQTSSAMAAAEAGDLDAARATAEGCFDALLAHASERETAAITEAVATLRVLEHLAQLEPADRAGALALLNDHPALRGLLAFSLTEHDAPGRVYPLLLKLFAAEPEAAARLPHLAVAVAAVHELPLKKHINENPVTAPDALAVFQYFAEHEKQMRFGLRSVPVELLVYVVDVTAPVEQLDWALSRYRGHRAVGELFFTIEYDYDHFRHGAAKRVTRAGFSLPNIAQYGGVCADQAYFASEVAKAIGVPSAYASGRSADNSHAWVGFLQQRGRSAAWNFDVGRYEAYQGVRGELLNPQTRQRIPDAHASLTAELIGSDDADRFAAAALLAMADRLGQLAKQEKPLDAPPLPETVRGRTLPEPRTPGPAAQLALIEASVRLCAGHAPAWLALAQLAGEGKLSYDDKRDWARRIEQIAGRRYPDFAFAILEPMIQTVDNPTQQNSLWEAAMSIFARRADLAAQVRMHQGQLWQDHGQRDKAVRCYQDVIDRFANAGPFVLEALEKLEQLGGSPENAARAYAYAFERIAPPKQRTGPFADQSNWYRVGHRLISKLEAAGLDNKAQQVRRQFQ